MTITEAWKMTQEFMPLLAFAAACALMFLGTKFVKHKRCDEHRNTIQGELADTTKRRKELEEAIQGLPTSKDLGAMKDSVSELSKQVSVLQEALNGQKALFIRLEGQVDRIDNFLKRMPN